MFIFVNLSTLKIKCIFSYDRLGKFPNRITSFYMSKCARTDVSKARIYMATKNTVL